MSQIELKYTDEDVDKIVSKKLSKWEMRRRRIENSQCMELQQQIAEINKKLTMAEINLMAREMLNKEGIYISDKLMSLIVCDEAAKTKEAVEEFVLLFQAAVKQEILTRVNGSMPGR